MDIVTAPKLSQFIDEQLDKNGWSLLDLCTMLGGIPKSIGSKIKTGKQAPSFIQMAVLAEIFEVSIQDIAVMRMAEETDNGKTPVVTNEQHEVIKIYKKIPINELMRHGWASVRDRNNLAEMNKVMSPYVTDIANSQVLAHKTHADDTKLTLLQTAWVLRSRQLAAEMTVRGEFKQSDINSCIAELKQLMLSGSNVSEVPAVLSKYGIRLVLVECKNSKIDAACTWLDEKRPVISMTLRFDRIDNFWFVLRHEIAHIEQGYSALTTVDCDMGSGNQTRELEIEANVKAQEFCAPSHLVDQFIQQANGRLSETSVESFARQNGILPAVLAGQIRHKLSKYNILAKLITSFRKELIDNAPVVDGWGIVPTM
jgi:HTH-type transcriptional regulator/antitoxin HigA|nr:MAG TPA: IrrE protein [Caudoviricetes sp.]